MLLLAFSFHSTSIFNVVTIPAYYFIRRSEPKLKMIWSSFSDGKYSVLEATADCLRGKWEHFKPRFDFDGGHAMIFETFDHKKYVSLHQPNVSPYERAAFLPYKENDCL